MYNLIYLEEAKETLAKLKKQGLIEKRKKIKSTLDKLSENPRHPGLHTHKNNSLRGYQGQNVFQSYIENKTPGAFRVFWVYGDNNSIIILAITPHP